MMVWPLFFRKCFSFLFCLFSKFKKKINKNPIAITDDNSCVCMCVYYHRYHNEWIYNRSEKKESHFIKIAFFFFFFCFVSGKIFQEFIIFFFNRSFLSSIRILLCKNSILMAILIKLTLIQFLFLNHIFWFNFFPFIFDWMNKWMVHQIETKIVTQEKKFCGVCCISIW